MRGDDTNEFALLAQNADEAGIPAGDPPRVRRIDVQTSAGRVSAIRWGDEPPQVVLLHGGGQNAHTWDTVILGLGMPALAVDLPGHGHSDWREDHDYGPGRNAETVAEALAVWEVGGVPVVGMSMGGLTAIALAARSPGTATRIAVVDVTPSVLARVAHMTTRQRGTTALVGGNDHLRRPRLHGRRGRRSRARAAARLPEPRGPAQRPAAARRPVDLALRRAAARRRDGLRGSLGRRRVRAGAHHARPRWRLGLRG